MAVAGAMFVGVVALVATVIHVCDASSIPRRGAPASSPSMGSPATTTPIRPHQWAPSPAPRKLDVGDRRAVTLHTLSEHPRLFRVDNILSGDECDAIVALARPQLQPSTTHHIARDGTRILTAWRTSDSAWLPKAYDRASPAVATLTQRAARALRLPRDLVEAGNQLQIIHYDGAGHYHPHYDSRRLVKLTPADEDAGSTKDAPDDDARAKYPVAARYATLLVFLSDVPPGHGGNTTFPFARMGAIPHELSQSITSRNPRAQHFWDTWGTLCDSNPDSIAKSFAPKKGSALLFYNHGLGQDGLVGDLDPWSLHGGCAVRPGAEKWAANLWIEVPPPHSQYRDATVTADLMHDRVMAYFDWFSTTLMPDWKDDDDGGDLVFHVL